MDDLQITTNANNRYIIINEKGIIIADANGYGFKTIKAAENFIWWKYKGGKEMLEEKEKIKRDYNPKCTNFPDAPF